MGLNFRIPRKKFSFETNGKFIILGVPIFKHIRVYVHANLLVSPCSGSNLKKLS